MVKTREIKLFITLHHVTRKCNIGEYANKMSTHTNSMTITAYYSLRKSIEICFCFWCVRLSKWAIVLPSLMIRRLWEMRREWDWYLVDFSTSLSLALFTLHVNTICFSKLNYRLSFCKWWNQICLFKQRCRYPLYGIYSGCYWDVSCLKRQHNSICRHVPTSLNSWGTSATQASEDYCIYTLDVCCA